MPVPLTRETCAGNQVTLRLVNGHFAHYAHLVPGSLRVKPGDQVKKGDVIALLGNSGNSKNPHLHFQVSDGVELNGSEGMPYVFDQFELYGHQEGGRMPSVTQAPESRGGEMPLLDAILRFRD
jgi:murein DD-endopeptidase MepM/ murein hydrolase activator NlpD